MTTINGLAITATASSTLTMADLKTFSVNNTMALISLPMVALGSNFGTGGGAGATVLLTLLTLLVRSQQPLLLQLRGVVSDSTGTGSLVFSTNPVDQHNDYNPAAQHLVSSTHEHFFNAFGAATALNMGAGSGTTTINNGLTLATT